jgi:16S rRNA processing protein RimM
VARSGTGAGTGILLGRIAAAHGVRGDVLIKTFTERPEDIAAYGPLDDGRGRSLTVKVVRVTPKGVVARIAGVADRNGAEALKGIGLHIGRDRLPAPEDGQFYHADLIGLAAVDPEGAAIGQVVGVFNHGAGDMLEVRLAATGKTELVAFTDAFVPDVDLKAGRVVVRLDPAGPDASPDSGPPPPDAESSA